MLAPHPFQDAIAAHVPSLAAAVAAASQANADTSLATAQVAEEIACATAEILRLVEDGIGQVVKAHRKAQETMLVQFNLTTNAALATFDQLADYAAAVELKSRSLEPVFEDALRFYSKDCDTDATASPGDASSKQIASPRQRALVMGPSDIGHVVPQDNGLARIQSAHQEMVAYYREAWEDVQDAALDQLKVLRAGQASTKKIVATDEVGVALATFSRTICDALNGLQDDVEVYHGRMSTAQAQERKATPHAPATYYPAGKPKPKHGGTHPVHSPPCGVQVKPFPLGNWQVTYSS